ncbi:MAG: histidine--tRNA ligase [Ginsengibacter sp.]
MKPSIPQGFRDFNAGILHRRSYIINTIKEVFELYAFEPLETPAMENLETLMGKYGDEGDKLIFKVLNNGLDHSSKQENARQQFENILLGKTDKFITERALRYDLTIPFARFVAMNHAKLTMPYKRYQIQPVWRADRPQKGRYREFYQCDADVAGTYSLISDVEFCQIYSTVFSRLKLNVRIKINNRKILSALAEVCGIPEKMVAITGAIDKLEKIGLDKVKEELSQNDLTEKQIQIIVNYINIDGTNEEKLAKIEPLLLESETGREGIDELKFILEYSKKASNDQSLVLDFTLARGLNYYTGTIYEVTATDAKMGSIGGGGRYDDLAGLFGVTGVPGVGISFGLDRIYDVLEELNLFPESITHSPTALFFNMGEKESQFTFEIMQKCRTANIPCEMYFEPAKMNKQFKYATNKNIRYAIIIGSKEMESNRCEVKDLTSGDQSSLDMEELIPFLKKNNS